MKLRLGLLIPLCLALGLHAQNKERISTGFDDIKAAKLRADLTFLASDGLEGRLSLTRGSEVAIQWIASEFAKAGLKPACSGTYLQPVELWDYRPDRQASFLKIPQGTPEETYRFPEAYGQYPQPVDISGPV